MTKKGSGAGWFGDHRRHVLAGKGVSTVLPDGRRLNVSKFVARGETVLDVDDVYRHFVVASLWATHDNVDEDIFLDENYNVCDVAPESEEDIKRNIVLFLRENRIILERLGIDEKSIGHDLFLDSQGHGVGFWDRDYGSDGDILSKSSEKYFGTDNPEVGDDGKIRFHVREVE